MFCCIRELFFLSYTPSHMDLMVGNCYDEKKNDNKKISQFAFKL